MSAVLPLPLTDAEPLRFSALRSRVEGLGRDELLWLSGYSAGLALAGAIQAALPPVAEPAVAVRAAPGLTIVYSSQTGNARKVGERLLAEAQAAGIGARLVRIDAYSLKELASEQLLWVAISTQGDGDPPDDARAFFDALAGRRAPKLAQLSYAVFGLGDSSYPQFCAAARRLDERLAELGATRLSARGEADLDFDLPAQRFGAEALAKTRERLESAIAAGLPSASVTVLRPLGAAATVAPASASFTARLLGNQRITARGARKDVRHLEFAVDPAVAWQPGDAVAITPRNAASLVDAVLAATGADGDATIDVNGQAVALRRVLAESRELTRLAKPLVAAHAERSGSAELARLLASSDPQAFSRFVGEHQFIDLLTRWPAAWSAADLAAALRPLAARSYSIASSRLAHEGELHLTVALRDDVHYGERRQGAASRQLADLAEDAEVEFELVANPRFRLPSDGTRDLIMIGPGTGVAPFRAFVAERAARGDRGRNWLVFGEQHFDTQFLYQLEWQAALKSGALARLDLAFSRDQDERVYVQHRLLQRAAEVYAWLEEGAAVYVCGDASRMAPDVHRALGRIVEQQRGVDSEGAADYLAGLTAAGRYQRDVY